MIKDGQVKELRRMLNLGKTLAASARMTEMTEKRHVITVTTSGCLPSGRGIGTIGHGSTRLWMFGPKFRESSKTNRP